MCDNSLIISENKILKERIRNLENELQQLDLQYFYFKTLYDASQEIAPLKNTKEIMKAFLMTILGTFGIFNGFIILLDKENKKIDFFENSYKKKWSFRPVMEFFEGNLLNIFSKKRPLIFFDEQPLNHASQLSNEKKKFFNFLVSSGTSSFVPFDIGKRFSGAIALGKKINEMPFSQIERELLSTLTSQLAVHILNAKSFETIQNLNIDLHIKNKTLEETLKKIQLLEKAKALLCKFVPKSLEKLIEDHPESPDLEKKEQDISILFLDIEGFTAISEQLKYEGITKLIETYFSHFFDDIHRFGGDINMTSGDGLMIIFYNIDKKTHALNAVKTAISIKQKTFIINQQVKDSNTPLIINIGIHSGKAFMGATRMEGYYGARWTYTALGSTVNIAARIGSFAKNGEILVSAETAARIREKFSVEYLGPKEFKNVKKEILLYRVLETHFEA
ncbi:MAG: adenylate/guanylate cyclase domain-containing protein [bacterium]